MDQESSRLEISKERMRDFFPAFSLYTLGEATHPELVWRGKVQPIRTKENLEQLLDDIHNQRPYFVMPGGEVLHHPECNAHHESHDWIDKLTRPHGIFELKVSYSGAKQHPTAHVIDPEIPENKRWHMFGNCAICPYAPWLEIWNWQEHTVVDYLGHVLGWLIKWMVRDQTGVWIGQEISHDPAFLLRSIGRNDECWCGSGKKYKKCHRLHDEKQSRASVAEDHSLKTNFTEVKEFCPSGER